MIIKRLTLAMSLGLGLILLLLWLLSTPSDVALAEVGTDTIHVAASGGSASNQGSPAGLYGASTVVSTDVGSYSSMALDSNGRLHVSFNNATSDGLFHGVYSDTSWHVQTVAAGGEILRNSIAADPNSDTPHISYEKDGDLMHAYLSGTEWITSTVVSRTYMYRHWQNAIAVDSSGYPHIAYSKDRKIGSFWFGDVEYAQWDGADWEFPTVHTLGEEVRSPICLALDSQDTPYILFKKRFFGGDFAVFLATRIDQAWEITTLEYDWYNTFPPGAALTIDDNDNVYWIYMWLGQRVGGTILPMTLLASGWKIGYSDIAVDDVGRVYIVFENDDVLQLSVKSPCDDEWVHTPLVSIATWRESDVSLTVVQDVVRVIYRDSTTQDLMHLSLPVASIVGQLEPLEVQPDELDAGSDSTATVTATVRDCAGPLANTPVTLTLNPSLDSTFISPQTGTVVHGTTDANGAFNATIRAGLQAGVVTVTATADGTEPQSATIRLIPATMEVITTFSILVDDFIPQPYQGESMYYYNRLGGDRGDLGGSVSTWGQGLVTSTIVSDRWGGIWMSLNHPIREEEPINFSTILPAQILPRYQSKITGLTFKVARGTSGRPLRIELKNEKDGTIHWSQQVVLTGGLQTLSYQLPPLGDTTSLLWIIDNTAVGDFVVVEHVALTATTQITDAALAGLVWGYGMLLGDWDPATGLVRDKARYASGEFDAMQSTGSLAAATAVAEQLGIVEHADAVQIVTAISNTLLTDIPRYRGLWPHWVKLLPSGTFTIVQGTEWSSMDTVIAAIALLEAQTALGLDTSGTEQMLQGIDWDALLTPNGISHGYTYAGTPIPASWDTFGGESWLVQLAYAAATGKLAPIKYCNPPTANGSCFIDELAWLFVPPPPIDCCGTDWELYRQQAADAQLSYYAPTPTLCLTQLCLFGLSAAEVPVPSAVTTSQIYQAFGVGGRFSPPNDGSSLLGAPVAVPHCSAMIASLRSTQAVSMWLWLINQGPLSPLNNVESLMFPAGSGCEPEEMQWNELKGSWNLVLQTLGWGRYLAQRQGQVPVLWQTITANAFLREGYNLVASVPVTAVHIHGPSEVFTSAAQFSADYEPDNAAAPVTLAWDNGTVGANATYT